MPVNPDQLRRSLDRGLAPVYLVSGDDTLLVEECTDAIRERARTEGYSEREVFVVESGFDWNALQTSTRSMSLFAERRLIELRLPTGKPGDTGTGVIAGFAADPPPDLLLVVISAKLDKGSRDSRWVQAIESAGTHVQIWPLDAQRLPVWITQRFAAHGLQPESGVVDLMAWHLEGNLLAVAQEIDKLGMLVGSGVVTRAEVEASLADSARFSIYQLVDAALAGEVADVRRMLFSLRAEGTEPILMQWALTRELRSLAPMVQERARGKPEAAVVARVWQNRRPVVTRALRRLTPVALYGLLRQAARLDRVIKGQAAGDRWLELERLLLAVSGLAHCAMHGSEIKA